MPKIITEDMIEQAAIKALQERHNYTVLNCMTEDPDTLPDGTGRKDKKQVVLPDVMLESLCLILSILVYTFFSRMFDLMLPPVAKHSIVVA